jgi:mannose-6-phosphate isomerase-like protein (cupin superfamily)
MYYISVDERRSAVIAKVRATPQRKRMESSMSGEYANAQARRVLTGLDESGKSTIVSDGFTPARLVTPGNTKCDIWRMDGLPGGMQDSDGLSIGVLTSPAEGGLVYRISTVPPDSEWDMSLGYRDANGPLPGTIKPAGAGGIPGMHFTETVDIVTVLSGEIYVVLETTETLLRPGDTLVQRGTIHAWSNRTDKPAMMVALMVSAKR